jgi:hypothetical protein
MILRVLTLLNDALLEASLPESLARCRPSHRRCTGFLGYFFTPPLVARFPEGVGAHVS